MLTALLTIVLLHWVALVTPGPNILVVSQLAANGDRASALCAGFGISVVAALWSALAILGINAVFTAHPHVRLFVQLAGGLYLCYLGIRFWRAAAHAETRRSTRLSSWSAFRLGILTNVSNPKSALFFGSVFATSLPVASGWLLAALAIALIFFNALVWHSLLAYAFAHPRVQLAYTRHQRALNRAAGVLIGAFGLRLLVGTLLDAKSKPGGIESAT